MSEPHCVRSLSLVPGQMRGTNHPSNLYPLFLSNFPSLCLINTLLMSRFEPLCNIEASVELRPGSLRFLPPCTPPSLSVPLPPSLSLLLLISLSTFIHLWARRANMDALRFFVPLMLLCVQWRAASAAGKVLISIMWHLSALVWVQNIVGVF